MFLVLIPWLLTRVAQYDRRLGISIFPSRPIRLILAALLVAAGLFFVLWSNIALFFIGKGGPADGMNIAVSPRTEKLVITGPFKHSRNPMVLGAYLLYFAIGIFENSLIVLLIVTAFLSLTPAYLRATEEKRLLRDFGDEYVRYRRRVRMFIPWPKSPVCRQE